MIPRYLPNTEVERLAIQAVRLHEKRRLGLHSVHEVRKAPNKSGYDLVSGDRKIEVKGTQGTRCFQQLCISGKPEFDNLRDDGWLYRVTGVGSGRPKVLELKGDRLRLVREKRWRVAQKKK